MQVLGTLSWRTHGPTPLPTGNWDLQVFHRIFFLFFPYRLCKSVGSMRLASCIRQALLITLDNVPQIILIFLNI